jgi:fumarate reductase subunit C
MGQAVSAAILQAKLWYYQRISAMVLALCVAIHLIIIYIAVQGGLTANEILGRTRGNWGFALFYEIFVLACFVHAPIGLANILQENIQNAFLNRALPLLLAALILILGSMAVIGVVWGQP